MSVFLSLFLSKCITINLSIFDTAILQDIWSVCPYFSSVKCVRQGKSSQIQFCFSQLILMMAADLNPHHCLLQWVPFLALFLIIFSKCMMRNLVKTIQTFSRICMLRLTPFMGVSKTITMWWAMRATRATRSKKATRAHHSVIIIKRGACRYSLY